MRGHRAEGASETQRAEASATRRRRPRGLGGVADSAEEASGTRQGSVHTKARRAEGATPGQPRDRGRPTSRGKPAEPPPRGRAGILIDVISAGPETRNPMWADVKAHLDVLASSRCVTWSCRGTKHATKEEAPGAPTRAARTELVAAGSPAHARAGSHRAAARQGTSSRASGGARSCPGRESAAHGRAGAHGRAATPDCGAEADERRRWPFIWRTR